jgi:ABC-type thiamine transport system ATPase subunit
LICVTHHPEDLPSSITHILKLEQGQVVASGPKDQVQQNLWSRHTCE